MPKTIIEIKQVLDVENPLTKLILLTAVFVIVGMFVVQRPFTWKHIEWALLFIAQTLVILYALQCMRNGACNMLSSIIGMAVLILQCIMTGLLFAGVANHGY